jgi:hypothetical protein
MSLPAITEADMLALGLRKNNLQPLKSPTAKQLAAHVCTFRKIYGIDPKTCVDVYKDIYKNIKENSHKVNPCDLLMAVEWLRKYSTDFEMASKYGLCEKTGSEMLWLYTRAIQAQMGKKIKWIDRWDSQESERIIVSVDGIHCTISKP